MCKNILFVQALGILLAVACSQPGEKFPPGESFAPSTAHADSDRLKQPEVLDANDVLLKDLPLPDKDIRWVRNQGKYRVQRGEVSHYKQPGEKTASGMMYRKDVLAAAHRKLPLYTIVRCTREDSGESVVVLINDRGPFVKDRILDVTDLAAKKLDLHGDGVAPCRIEVLAYPQAEDEEARE